MAVKTIFSEEDFSKILSLYDLGKYKELKPISAGTVQTNYILETTKGKFIFRYYENRSIGSVKFETNLINYLINKKYPCPSIFKNKQGKFMGIYKNKPYVIYEFIDGVHLKEPTKNQNDELIKNVAKLQTITNKYKPSHKSERWNYSPELCKQLALDEAKKINNVDANEKANWLVSELKKLSLSKSLPKGICHCDFHFSNVLFKDGEFKALIDFDDANYTYLIFDLIGLINVFIPSFEWDSWQKFNQEDNVFNFKESRNVINEYMKYRPLSSIEKKSLFDVCKLAILFDSIWYFKRGNSNDFYEKRKIDYLNSLGRDKFYKSIFT